MRSNEFPVELNTSLRIYAFNVAPSARTSEKMDDDRDVLVWDVDKDIEPTGIRIVANPTLSLDDFRRLLAKCAAMMDTCTEEKWQTTLREARAEIERRRPDADEPWL